MHPQHFGRTALMRLLSNAHASPYRLFKQNVIATPACGFCSCQEADVLHIAYHCPRFDFLRTEWCDETKTWATWPPCAQQCLIACETMPPQVLQNWHKVQEDVAKLFETWMAFRRNSSLVQPISQESHSIDVAAEASASHPEQHNAVHALVERHARLVQRDVRMPPKNEMINLEWSPPTSTWAFFKWGACAKDYAVLFSFWTKWTLKSFQDATPCNNWTQVFYIFIQLGGHIATFVHCCPNLGTVIWKFRNLSLAILEQAWPGDCSFSELDFANNQDKHWCLRMPPAKPFPPNFFLAMPWDIRESCARLVEKQTQIAILKNLQYKHHLLEVPEFLLQFLPNRPQHLTANPLGLAWVHRQRRKRPLLRWEASALNPQISNVVRSVAARPLEFWAAKSPEDIKKCISPSKSAKRQFTCMLIFFISIQAVFDKHLSANDPSDLPHLPLVCWDDTIPICRCCSTILNFVQCPTKIYRKCPHALLLENEILRHEAANCKLVIQQLQSIIARL